MPTVLFDGLVDVHYAYLLVTSAPGHVGPEIGETLRGQRNESTTRLVRIRARRIEADRD